MPHPAVPAMDWDDYFNNPQGQQKAEFDAAMQQVMQYYNQYAQKAAPSLSYNTAQMARPPIPAHQGWDDEDLVGAATYWGVDEQYARQLPRDALIKFVNQQRDFANKNPVGTGLNAMDAFLAPIAVAGVNIADTFTGSLLRTPLLGDYLRKGGIVQTMDLKLRQLEEGVRAQFPKEDQGILNVAGFLGDVAGMFYPASAAWSIAGKVGKIVKWGSVATPIGRAMIQGGIAGFLQSGALGKFQEDPNHAVKVASDVALGAAGAGLWEKFAPALGPLISRVGKSLGMGIGKAFDMAGESLEPGGFSRMAGGTRPTAGEPEIPNFLRGETPTAQPPGLGHEVNLPPSNEILRQKAEAGDQQAQMMLDYLNRRRASISVPEWLGSHGERAAQTAEAEAAVDNKVGTIVNSVDFPEIATQTNIDDMAVVHAALADNPGGTSIVQGVADPATLGEVLGPHGQFVVRNGRLDLILRETPLSPRALDDYATHGVYTGQRVFTSDGIGGTVKGISREGNVRVNTYGSHGQIQRPASELHPWNISPEAQEVPQAWDSFMGYVDQKAAEVQGAMGGSLSPETLGMVKQKNLAAWMESFFDDQGITDVANRARLGEYFNHQYMSLFRDAIPAENAFQQAALESYDQAVAAHPPTAVGELDEHAATKGFVAVPKPGWEWELHDMVNVPGGKGRSVSFTTKDAAQTWLKNFNRELPDITPTGEIPLEVMAHAGQEVPQPPNLNAVHDDILIKEINEAHEAGAAAGEPPESGPPPELLGAAGNRGRLQSMWERARSHIIPMRNQFAAYDNVMNTLGMGETRMFGDWDAMTRSQNIYHSRMEPFQDELADLLAPVKRERQYSGEWGTAWQMKDPVAREAFTTQNGWTDKEKASLDGFTDLIRRLHPNATPEEVDGFSDYITHIAGRQSVPQTAGAAFDEFFQTPVTLPFYKFASKGQINFRELSPRTLGDTYIRSVMWDRYMAEMHEGLTDKYKDLADHELVGPGARFMLEWLGIIKNGFHPKNDLVLQGAHELLKFFVDPGITEAQAKDFVMGGLNASYAGMIGYRPSMIARHTLQLTYALPRAGTKLIQTLGEAVTRPGAMQAMLEEAAADGAQSPRTFTMNSPGALQGEMEMLTTGHPPTGPEGLPEEVTHTKRFEALAKIHAAIMDHMPDALKGHADSILRPLGAFSKAIERFRTVVYISGKRQAAEALANYRLDPEAEGAFQTLMGDSKMRTYDPAVQREFQARVAAGEENDNATAGYAGRQLAGATFFNYGTAQGPEMFRSVTGKVGLQLGHYSMNYLSFLNESTRNGTIGDKMKMGATVAAVTLGLREAAKATGWGFTWLNPWAGGTPTFGPAMDVAKTVGDLGKDVVQAIFADDPARLTKIQAESKHLGSQVAQMSPVGGLLRAGAVADTVQNSPNPLATSLDYLLTNQASSQPEWDRAPFPQADPGFAGQVRAVPSAMRADSVGLPGGVAPAQPVVDPPQLQFPLQYPSGIPTTPGTSPTPAAGFAPGSVETYPRVYPQFRRR